MLWISFTSTIAGIKIGSQIALKCAMANGTVVLVGNLSAERPALDLLIDKFGWSLEEAGSLGHVAELNAGHNLVAVLFSPRSLALPWDQALRAIVDAAPRALPILCHGFRERIDWPQAARAGAFHSLHLPFCVQEIRQSLGFVFDAKCRPALIPARQPRLRTAVKGHARQANARAARISA